MKEQEETLLPRPSRTSSLQDRNNIFFELIQKVGSFGKYQILVQIVWCTISYINGGLTLILPFLMFQDPYLCQPQARLGCKDFVCNLNPSQRTQYIPAATMISLPNRVGDYRCPSEMSQLNLLQTLMYSGYPVGIFLLGVIGGHLGKRTIMLGDMIIVIVGLAILIGSDNLLMGGIGMFLCIFGSNMAEHITIPFITETISQKSRSTYSMLIMATFSVGGLANVLWFYLLRDFQLVLLYCYLVPAVLATAALIFFVKDTPICMVTKGSPEKALKGLRFIAEVNGRDFDLTLQEIRIVKQEYILLTTIEEKQRKHFTIIDLFRFKSLRRLILAMVLLDISITLEYYAPTFMLDQFKFSIFVNGLAVESSTLLASLLSWCMVFKYKRRVVAMVSFGILLASSAVLVFIWDQDKEQVTDISSDILVLCFIFVVQFAITNQLNFYWVYINELFPAQVRIVSLGFIKTCGGIILMVESLIISLCLSLGFKIMILFSVLAVLSIVCSYILPETLGRAPEDMIAELRGDKRKQQRERDPALKGPQ